METLKRFTVFYPYVKVIEHLARDDVNLAGELSYRIIMYGIYGKEPPWNSNKKVLEHFERVKPTLEKFRNRSIKRLNHWVNLYEYEEEND